MMARFQASGGSTEETTSQSLGRVKQPLHPTLSSPVQSKKPAMESSSANSINVPPKPNFLKNTVSTKSDTEVHEPNKTKALASRFANAQSDTNTNSKPSFIANKQPPDPKSLGLKPPLGKPSLSSDSKPTVPKPPPAIVSKPSWVKEDKDSGGSPASTTPPKLPLQQKPSSSFTKLRRQSDDTDTGSKPSLPANFNLKPVSNVKAVQSMFNKDVEKTEQVESGAKTETHKPALTATNSIPPPMPLAAKKPSLKKPSKPLGLTSSVNGDASGPKRNPLPNSLALGPAPAKPNRPPKVNLENFKRGAEASDDGESG